MHLSDDQISALIQAFLTENAKMNLSAFRTEEHCRIGNVQDSLAILETIDPSKVTSFLDLGTGGGFPLLPLAMAMPQARAVGIDSIEKKVMAVRRIAESCGLTSVTVLAGRIEELARRDDLRTSFDMVTARALAPLPILLEYAIPFLRVGGMAAFWKSTKIADELASTAEAQKLLRCAYTETFEYDLPGDWGKRSIVFFQKTADTPDTYPRKIGVPKNDPLG